MSGDKYKIANQQHPYFFQMFNFSVTNAFFKRPRYKRGRGGGNNQFSITSNRFDFDYQSNASFGRNAGTFVGGAVFGQFYTIPITPFSILRDVTGFGGSFMINFNGTVTIPK
ncbi:MAG: hypothetical protein ACK50L_05350 [Bacteroidota bacterium]